MEKKYPSDEQIKPKWSTFQVVFLVVSTLILLTVFGYRFCSQTINLSTSLTITGLYIDIVGVIIASLKTPYFGSFFDGGEIEFKRQKADSKVFQKGMLLVGTGFLLQAIGVII